MKLQAEGELFLKGIFLKVKTGNRSAFLFALVLLAVLFSGAPASAAVEALIAKSSDGSYYRYSYQELLDSYALKLLGSPDGLYEDFAAKNIVAFQDTLSGYIDYGDILEQYALTLLNGQKFNLNRYTESGLAKKKVMPPVVMEVSLAEGQIVRAPGNPEHGLPPAPAPVTPLVAPAGVTLDRALQWASDRGAHQRFIDIAPLYWEYGAITGLSPELLYAQSAYETNFGRFTGLVPPEYNNWAGIKIAASSGDKPEDHEQFTTPEDGVRAHFNHMAAYTGLNPVGEPHGRYYVVLRLSWAGAIKTVEELSGKWAPSPTYHERILSMVAEMQQ